MEVEAINEKLEETEQIDLNKVQLNRTWSFWETYEPKEKSDNDYNQLVKEIFSFDNIIAFWQFYNKYPGSTPTNVFFNGEAIKFFFEEKYRIISINLFEKGIRPEWEDEKNKGAKIFVLDYVVEDSNLNNFFGIISEAWTKLQCITIGETIPSNNFINGIRFVDKTKLSAYKKNMFRLEVWVNKGINDKDKEVLESYLKKEFHCPGAYCKNI